MLERRVQMGDFSQLYDIGEVLVVHMSVDAE